ncbi:hypothetical protein [Lonepinella sp. BR2357]|uniref:hypothetical protein n=1 Tax=Lonepinella sp. BR2357 TaxID=3434549 RepID=UPI003F6E24C4
MKLIKLSLALIALLFIQSTFAKTNSDNEKYGCQASTAYLKQTYSDFYCTPDGTKLFTYGKVTQEMKNIKISFRSKTYTYKDLIQPLDYNKLIGIKEFTKKIENFNFALEDNLHAIKNYSQLEELLKVRGDYLEQILNNKFYNNSIINDLIDIDKKIISLFDRFKVSQENQNLFKTGSAEKHRTLEIMNNYIKLTPYGI